MRIEYSWFADLPGIDIEDAKINGNEIHGMAFSARHADTLRAALISAHGNLIAQVA